MATATTPVSSKMSYPAEAVGRLFAPPESEVPADKLRRLLHEARDGQVLPPHRRRLRRLHLGHHDHASASRRSTAAAGSSPPPRACTPTSASTSRTRWWSWCWRCGRASRAPATPAGTTAKARTCSSAPPGVRRHGGGLRRPDPDLHPGHRADPGRRRRRPPREPGPVEPHLRPHRERRQAEAEQGAGAPRRRGSPSSRPSRPRPRPPGSTS